jgi:hypothetical protein
VFQGKSESGLFLLDSICFDCVSLDSPFSLIYLARELTLEIENI